MYMYLLKLIHVSCYFEIVTWTSVKYPSSGIVRADESSWGDNYWTQQCWQFENGLFHVCFSLSMLSISFTAICTTIAQTQRKVSNFLCLETET